MDKRIKELRKKLGLTQQTFADRIGTPRSNIAGYEVRKNVPSDAIISLICREFNVNEEWLRNGTGEMFKEMLLEDEVAAFVEDLLEEKDNPFFSLIIDMMRTYHELDDVSRQTALEYFRRLRDNIKK